MKASGWKSASYGIRVGKENARTYFKKSWDTVEIEIDGIFHTFSLSKNFWTTSPEIRGAAIGRWLEKNGLTTWPPGKPPQVILSPLEGNRFRLSR
ncbi:MAG TPA: hypothetical protein PK728_00680 [Bacillota bacterium]|nr:hypothetical protein [Bacillota bacterium]